MFKFAKIHFDDIKLTCKPNYSVSSNYILSFQARRFRGRLGSLAILHLYPWITYPVMIFKKKCFLFIDNINQVMKCRKMSVYF